MSVPNLKRRALFVQKLLGGPKFRPAADPLRGGAGPPKFNQLEPGDGHYLHLQTKFGEDRCTQFLVIVVTDTARPPATNTPTKAQTQRGPITIYTAPLASAQDAREDTIRRLFNSNIISRHQRPWRRYAHYAECNSSLSFTHIRNGYDLLRTIVSEEVDLFTNEFATDPQPKAEVA